MRHLPSFKALQAFEATMRHGTLSDAARDLNVTPGAVSRQISALEDDLGFKLMTRHHEGITPNHPGEKLARVLGKSFKDISDVIQELRDGAFRETLTLKVFPTVAIQWLVPRLANFHGLAPDIDLHIRTSLNDARFDMEDIDVAIMIGDGNWPKLRAHRLFPRLFTLVCNPQLLQDKGPVLAQHFAPHASYIPNFTRRIGTNGSSKPVLMISSFLTERFLRTHRWLIRRHVMAQASRSVRSTCCKKICEQDD
jgi:LysR family glycine cleavage system transcriptional activator